MDAKGHQRAVTGRVSIARSLAHRSLDISLEYLISSVQGEASQERIASSYSIAMT